MSKYIIIDNFVALSEKTIEVRKKVLRCMYGK